MLSSRTVLLILINSILGSSLFYLPSLAVISSGPASILAWVAVFILATFTMLYIAELVTNHPTSGGTYEYCKLAYGRFVSFLAGWTIWLAGNLGMALALIAAAQYFIPDNFFLQMGFVTLWVLVLNFMAYRGVDVGVNLLVVFGVIALVVVGLMTLPSFIDLPALLHLQLGIPFALENLRPFFIQDATLRYLGFSFLLIIEAFFGFEVITYLGDEINTKKLPRTLITAMILSGVIMTLYFFSSLGTVPYLDYVSDARPFVVQAFNTMGFLGKQVVTFGMYLVIIGTAAAWPITGGRLIRAMAADKLFISHLAVLHHKHKSPHRAIYFQTIAVLFFSWILFRGYGAGWQDPYRSVYLIYVLLSLIVLSLVLGAVPLLRKPSKQFKAPLPKLGPLVVVVFFLVLIYNWVTLEGNLAWSLIRLSLSLIVVGIPFYFMVEMFYRQKSILGVTAFLSGVSMRWEQMFFPLMIRGRIRKILPNLRNRKVLEYGCTQGKFTRHLAFLGKEVHAIAASKHKVNRTTKTTADLTHVRVYHYPHLHKFDAKIPKVDVLISVGMLSYLQHPEKVLKDLGAKMKKGGDVFFVDYDKFFHIIPNVRWIESDLKLRQIFHKAGFQVTIKRKWGLLWQYIIIRGRKL